MTKQQKQDRLDMIARIARGWADEDALTQEHANEQDAWKEANFNSQEGML
jgi:hypothetical protein